MIKEENQNLATKIRNQEEIISQHRILMGGTPEEKRQKVKIDTFYK